MEAAYEPRKCVLPGCILVFNLFRGVSVSLLASIKDDIVRARILMCTYQALLHDYVVLLTTSLTWSKPRSHGACHCKYNGNVRIKSVPEKSCIPYRQWHITLPRVVFRWLHCDKNYLMGWNLKKERNFPTLRVPVKWVASRTKLPQYLRNGAPRGNKRRWY